MSKIVFQTKTGKKEFDAGKDFATIYAGCCLRTLGVPVELRNESGNPVPIVFKPVESNGDYEVHVALPTKTVELKLDRQWHVDVAFRVFSEAANLPVYWRMRGEEGARGAANLEKYRNAKRAEAPVTDGVVLSTVSAMTKHEKVAADLSEEELVELGKKHMLRFTDDDENSAEFRAKAIEVAKREIEHPYAPANVVDSRIDLWIDGSCIKKAGEGRGYAGWGAYIQYFCTREDRTYDGSNWEFSGSIGIATNIVAEMEALKHGLLEAEKLGFDKLTVYGDNTTVIGGLEKLQSIGRPCIGKRVANIELWREIAAIIKRIGKPIEAKLVKGHNGVGFNELVDKLAQDAARKAQFEGNAEQIENEEV